MHRHLALALLRAGDARAAVRAADVALALEGAQAPAALHLRGAALLRCGRAAEAVEALRQAVASSAGDTGLLTELATAECAIGDVDAALAHADAAVSLRPRDSSAQSAHALALLAAERWQEAEAAARRALESNHGDVQASNNLGLALAAQGKLPEARRFLRDARVHSETMRDTHDVVARNQRLLGAGDNRRGGLRTAALSGQLRGVLALFLIAVYAFLRSPWVLPVLVVAAAILLRLLVFRGAGGGRLSPPRLTALPAVARVTVARPPG